MCSQLVQKLKSIPEKKIANENWKIKKIASLDMDPSYQYLRILKCKQEICKESCHFFLHLLACVAAQLAQALYIPITPDDLKRQKLSQHNDQGSSHDSF